MNITIHTTVSYNSISYLNYLYENYKHLSSKKTKIFFNLNCLDNMSYYYFKFDKRFNLVNRLGFERGSLGHALSLNQAIKDFDKKNLNIISDVDIVIVRKNWDILIQNFFFENSKLGMIGVSYENIDGFSTGASKFQTYKNQPTATWMVLSPKFNFSELSFLPQKDNFLNVNSKKLSNIYQLPIGFSLLKDVGWEIPMFLYNKKIQYKTLKIVKPVSKKSKVLYGLSQYHDEFHLDSIPFLVHQRGSMKHNFRIDQLSRDFYNACDKYLGFPVWSVKPKPYNYISNYILQLTKNIKKNLYFLKR